MSDDLDLDLARLREAYRHKLPRRLDELERLLRSGKGGGRESLARAREVAHRLKGTSGSYGFLETSRALRRIEDELERLLDGAAQPTDGEWGRIESLLAEARRLLDAPAPAAG